MGSRRLPAGGERVDGRPLDGAPGIEGGAHLLERGVRGVPSGAVAELPFVEELAGVGVDGRLAQLVERTQDYGFVALPRSAETFHRLAKGPGLRLLRRDALAAAQLPQSPADLGRRMPGQGQIVSGEITGDARGGVRIRGDLRDDPGDRIGQVPVAVQHLAGGQRTVVRAGVRRLGAGHQRWRPERAPGHEGAVPAHRALRPAGHRVVRGAQRAGVQRVHALFLALAHPRDPLGGLQCGCLDAEGTACGERGVRYRQWSGEPPGAAHRFLGRAVGAQPGARQDQRGRPRARRPAPPTAPGRRAWPAATGGPRPASAGRPRPAPVRGSRRTGRARAPRRDRRCGCRCRSRRRRRCRGPRRSVPWPGRPRRRPSGRPARR